MCLLCLDGHRLSESVGIALFSQGKSGFVHKYGDMVLHNNDREVLIKNCQVKRREGDYSKVGPSYAIDIVVDMDTTLVLLETKIVQTR